ncbi:MAG: DNA polymerase IV [Tunicatimonas sp.]
MDGEHIRKIIHIDMDAFYASVEQRDFPEYQGKAIAVGGGSDRGVVAAASYEARRFGVHSALASVKARQRCPELIFVKARFDVYREVSQQIRAIFRQYTDLVEPLSLDEAYLDVTDNKLGIRSAIRIAMNIREQIQRETQLTASAGVSYNKFLAKVASDINKPNGLKAILPHEAEAFLETLPIEKFHGIGRVTARKMHRLGIGNGAALKQAALETLAHHFGKAGRYYYHIVRGRDERIVNPARIRKSVSAERTFQEDLRTPIELREQVHHVTQLLTERLEKAQAQGFTLTLKIKYADFSIITRSVTQKQLISDAATIEELAREMLDQVAIDQHAVRLLGIGVSNLLTPEKSIHGVQLQFAF